MSPVSDPHDDARLARYARQTLFEPLGVEGQRRLLASRVTLIGCGALGTALANTLVRAGVGFVRIVDRDYIEPDNLQRQVLFDEQDIADNLPKAEAARRKFARINSQIDVEAIVADVGPANVERLIDGAHVILDGTDNFETRYLINDAAIKHRVPWVYGACVAATGLAMPILPGETPCLRCMLDRAPPAEMIPTCETVGVLGPVVAMVAAYQAMEAIKILAGRLDAVNRRLVQWDLWAGQVAQIRTDAGRRRSDCPCCGRGEYEYLDGSAAGGTATLCGRDAVQVSPPRGTTIDLNAIAQRLASVASSPPVVNRFLLRARVDRYELAVFPDGRAIIKGTHRPEEARSLYAKYVGS